MFGDNAILRQQLFSISYTFCSAAVYAQRQHLHCAQKGQANYLIEIPQHYYPQRLMLGRQRLYCDPPGNVHADEHV